MKPVNKYIILSPLAFLILATGCGEDSDMPVYIPEARTLQVRNFNLNEPLLETFHVAVTGSEYATASGMDVESEIKFTLEVNPEKVEEYNSSCGTSYNLLPSNCYTLTNEGVIPAGSSISEDLTLNVEASGKLRPFDSYLLPITISTVSGGRLDNKQQTIYYLLSGAEDVWNMPLADRSNWNVVEVSSEETSGEGSENGHAIHAFDGNKNTFWHTQWKGDEPQPPTTLLSIWETK